MAGLSSLLVVFYYHWYSGWHVRNKTMEINSAILSSQSQLITITESWIHTNENDDFLIKECLPENYIPLSFPG